MDNYKELKKEAFSFKPEAFNQEEYELEQNLNKEKEKERLENKERAEEYKRQQKGEKWIPEGTIPEVESALEEDMEALEEKREEVSAIIEDTVRPISTTKHYKKNKRQIAAAKRYRQKKERKRERDNKLEMDELIKKEAQRRLNKTMFDQYSEEQEFRIEAFSPDLEKMKSEHEVVMEYTLKKKNIIKPDEYEYKAKVTDKESKVEEKRRNAKRLEADLNMVTDRSVRSRREVPMDIKKKFDYRTFSDLNDVTQFMNEQDGMLAMKLMGEYNEYDKGYETRKKNDPQKAEKVRQYDKETRLYPAMDLMSDHIMKIDYLSLDMSNDTVLVKNAIKLEEMSKAVQGFTKMLQQHPDYLEYSMKRKLRERVNDGEADTDVSFGERLMKRLDLLTALSDYYRVRRLIIEDETYSQFANEEISYEETAADTPQMKRVKKLLRSSFYLAQNISEELGGRYGVPQGFKDGDGEGLLLRNKINYDVEDAPGYREMLKKVEETGDSKEILKFKEKFNATRDKQIANRIKEFGEQSKRMYELENSRYFIAPNWMRGALSIDPAKQVTKKKPGTYYSVGDAGTDMPMQVEDIAKRGKKKLAARFKKMGNDKTQGANWGDCPKFDGGKDDYLKGIQISDSWNRIFHAMSTEYAYRRTDEEMLEMADLLSIQKDVKWKEIKDPEEIAFYESAYKEMAMKLLSMEYATAVRQSESIGIEAFLLHPVDLAMQMTAQLRSVSMTNSIVTNVDTEGNLPLVDKLFKENNTDGRYEFDTKLFHAHGCMVASLNMKLQNLCSAFTTLVVDDDREEDCEAMFGDAKYYNNVISPELKKMQDKKDPEALKIKDTNSKTVIIWYFSRHMEFFTPEYLNKKVHGRFILGDDIQQAYWMQMSSNEDGIRTAVKNNLVNKYDQTELDAYEESLKKRGFSPVRHQAKDDDPNEKVTFTSKDGKAKIELKRSDIIKNREADPYGLKVVSSGFDELMFKDKEGNEYMRTGYGQM
ncbi:MAG: hypothetical protein K5853_03530 [Lachnospiraceae bacterium]|nr:hypothetical protein [Lachnospiraceae bacterium]